MAKKIKHVYLQSLNPNLKDSKSNKDNELIENVVVNSSQIVNDLVRKIWSVGIDYRESAIGVYMDRKNKTIGYSLISIGGVSGTVVDAKLIFQQALMLHASSFILVHNHPSGNTKPSQADIKLTKKLKDAGDLLDIKMLDSIIIVKDIITYYSFADEGIMP